MMAKWNVDTAHTNVGFSVTHMMFSKVHGRFTQFEGVLEGNPDDFANAKINFEIDVASVDTNNEDRDNHLRSGDFFDVETYPKMTFVSKQIKSVGGNKYDIVGDITIKDTTKEITFTTTFLGKGTSPFGAEVAAFEAESKLSRKEFGITWNQAIEAGGVLVSDEIKITLDVQLNPAE